MTGGAVMKAEALIAAVLLALPAAAGEGQSLGVAELRSRLPADDRASIDGAALAGQVRDVARRTLPEAEVLDDSAATGDLAVSGEVLRIEQGFLVSLELRESRSNRLLGTASSAASTPEEVGDAVASASVDLFRAYKAAATLAMTPAAVPDAPQAFHPIGPLTHAADQANDARGALDYFDRGCSVSDADACAEAGDRFLRTETRDVARAIPALQGGCSAGGAKACMRLARVYEEGDGTAPDVAAAA